ncbi:MAG: type II toxin-antitoxin system VapC family toxin [Candidatus Methanoperedenaceae archaeon]|nr:type II toxin-antitoxin system VapC family toxin [Candidatus Methanoperedenaceae archaeon]
MKPICIDANVFIASTKGDEQYSSDCKRVIQAVVDGEFYLIEPTICLTEIVRNITKYLGMEAGKTQENNLLQMVSIWEICDDHFCACAGYTGALYGTYALDSIYLETALKHHAVLVTLDDKDFLQRIKGRVEIEFNHPKYFP